MIVQEGGYFVVGFLSYCVAAFGWEVSVCNEKVFVVCKVKFEVLVFYVFE